MRIVLLACPVIDNVTACFKADLTLHSNDFNPTILPTGETPTLNSTCLKASLPLHPSSGISATEEGFVFLHLCAKASRSRYLLVGQCGLD
ncbi:hypothetical protein UPYG_G00317550 [Umbra pygmaea]|uniref:Uncharacterized protein n=1 Tax=Umbra pygmaea TaxID=75934 RepID=A0ABD0W004_UMBPY